MLSRLPLITLVVLIGPVTAGLIGTLLPALGHLPGAGRYGPSAEPFRALFAWNGLPKATALSLWTGLAATLVSLSVTMMICAGWSGTRSFAWVQRALSPLLSVPHAAAAFGLAAIIAPSGWIARGIAQIAGWQSPPDVLILNDPWGLALIGGLVLKEVPFLLLMTLAALPQTAEQTSLRLSQTLGYDRTTSWFITIFPLIYRQIRLPIYVVLAFSMSVVDTALILGPTTPPTLSVQIVKWMGHPDLSLRTTAAAAALWQIALCVAALILWHLAEKLLAAVMRRWTISGRRRRFQALRPVAVGAALLCVGAALLGLLALVVWSFAGLWSFPDLLPQSLSLRIWGRHGSEALEAASDTLIVASLAMVAALALVLALLEAEFRTGRPFPNWALYIPLLVPQTAFLPGLNMVFLRLGVGTGLLPVILAHFMFVFPYIYLSLSDPFRHWDHRLATLGQSLGASPSAVFWRVRLPMMLRAVLVAAAIGMAVSIGQYLPTLLIGGGRVATLTTEAVALASGADRRAIGLYGIAQTAAALAPFALALILPAWIYRNRRALRHD